MRNVLRLLPVFALAACTAKNSAPADTGAAAVRDTGKAMATDVEADKDAIGKIRSGWMDNANKKDAAAVANYYSDDATFVGTQSPITSGRADIQKAFGQSFAVSKTESIDSKDIAVNGEVAVDYGTFRQVVTPPKGKAQTINGYYMVELRRQSDGSWKIVHHVATTPPAEP